MTQPSLFISHGAPSFALENSPARSFLSGLGKRLARPEAIIVISAHHIGRGPQVTSAVAPETIYDFRGFPDALYNIIYPAPGSPDLAREIVQRLQRDGHIARLQAKRGYDHGAWIPLHLMFPAADIPVVQISIDMTKDALWHYQLGRSLAAFRSRNALIIGSGSLTHGLPDFFGSPHELDEEPPQWVRAFSDWMQDRLEEGSVDDVLAAVEKGPFGRRNHPTIDHLLPLFVAMGAAHDGVSRALHRSTNYGILAMDAYAMGDAPMLATIQGLAMAA